MREGADPNAPFLHTCWKVPCMSVFQKSDHQVYFLYGSNANPKQAAVRGGRAERLGVARLADYRLAFFGHSGTWDSGEETLVESPGDEAWGVLYRMTLGDAEQFDAWQGARLDGSGPYFHLPVEVVGLDGRRHAALIYRKDSCREASLPSNELLAFIIEGALAQGLPPAYIARLRALESHRASHPVPKRECASLSFACTACSGCG